MPTLTKRQRTRRQLIEAGLSVLAERGESLTASDVVVAAEVSNGTFYNHFVDRDDFLDELARESLLALANTAALDTEGADPAWRFAVASTRVLATAASDPIWGRALLRLSERPVNPQDEIHRHLRDDLDQGHAAGQFRFGADTITVDLVTGTLMASIRRLANGPATPPAIPDIVARLLEALGLRRSSAQSLARRAHEQQTATATATAPEER